MTALIAGSSYLVAYPSLWYIFSSSQARGGHCPTAFIRPMSKFYDHQAIEKKWQAYWREHQPFRSDVDPAKPKFYVLDMFPYPSGAGLHVGHPKGYIATDIIARHKRMLGYNVLHPWDGTSSACRLINTRLKPGCIREQHSTALPTQEAIHLRALARLTRSSIHGGAYGMAAMDALQTVIILKHEMGWRCWISTSLGEGGCAAPGRCGHRE